MKEKAGYHILLIFGLLILTQHLAGQRQKPKNDSSYDEKLLHFGFTLGFNSMDFNITPSQRFLATDSLYPEVSTLNPGINIQIVTNLRAGRYFDVRFQPGVSFGQRTIDYYKNQVPYPIPQKIESSFIEFPLLLKYKGERLNNVRPYVIGGLNYRYDLAGKKEYDDKEAVYIRLKRPDLYIETGAGFDFYLTYFKLSIELKMSNGIGNVLIGEPVAGHAEYFNAIDKMKSQLWVLSFHFE